MAISVGVGAPQVVAPLCLHRPRFRLPRNRTAVPRSAVRSRTLNFTRSVPRESCDNARMHVPSKHLAETVFGPIRSGHVLAVFDQIIVSAASFLTTVMVGRFAGPHTLGVYAVGFSIVASFLAVLEALISTPYAVYRHHAIAPTASAGASLVQAGGLSAAGAVLLVIAACFAWTMDHDEMARMLWVLAVATPFVLAREFARRFAFAHLRMAHALGLDLAAATVNFGILVWLVHTGQLSTATAFAALGVACAVASIGWLLAMRSAFTLNSAALLTSMRANWMLGRWLFATQVVVSIQGLLVYWLLAWVQDAVAIGIYTACTSIALFSNPIILGVSNYLTPNAASAWAEGGGERLLMESKRDFALLGAVLLLFCGLALLYGAPLLQILYSSKAYAGNADTIAALCFGMLIMALGVPAINALTSMHRSQVLFTTAVLSALVTGCTVWWLARLWGPAGAAVGVLLGNAVRSATRWGVFLVVVPRPSRGGTVQTRPLKCSPLFSIIQQWPHADISDQWAVEVLERGRQADVYIIRYDGRTPPEMWPPAGVIVKRYDPEATLDTLFVRQQYEMLSRLRDRLHGRSCHGWTICTRFQSAPVYHPWHS